MQIVEVLLRCEADLGAPPAKQYERTPFEGATEHGQIAMMKFLGGNNILEVDREHQVKRPMPLAGKNGMDSAQIYAAELWRNHQQGQEGNMRFS